MSTKEMKAVRHIEETASAAYEARQAEILKLLEQVKDGLEKHDRRASCISGHHWGHVGDLISIADTLTDLSDRLHLTGEYSK